MDNYFSPEDHVIQKEDGRWYFFDHRGLLQPSNGNGYHSQFIAIDKWEEYQLYLEADCGCR